MFYERMCGKRLVTICQEIVDACQLAQIKRQGGAIAENARLMAENIRKEANLGDLAKDVRIISAVYDLDSGKVEWGKD